MAMAAGGLPNVHGGVATAVGGLAAAPVATACQPCELRQPATARKRQRISQTRQGR